MIYLFFCSNPTVSLHPNMYTVISERATGTTINTVDSGGRIQNKSVI